MTDIPACFFIDHKDKYCCLPVPSGPGFILHTFRYLAGVFSDKNRFLSSGFLLLIISKL